MKNTCTQLILLVLAVLMVVPVLAEDTNTTNATAVPTVATTTLITTVTTETTTAPVPATTAVPVTTTVPVTMTSPVPVTTTVPATPVTTTLTVTETAAARTGDLAIASTPLGASVLLDGVYYGTTPINLTGIPSGNHEMRLALSGYYDYEGAIYILAGQNNHFFGTLHPVSAVSAQTTAAATPIPATTTAVPAATATATPAESSDGPFQNPTVIAALIGIITACIGAGATIFTHNAKVNAEVKEEKKDGDGKKE